MFEKRNMLWLPAFLILFGTSNPCLSEEYSGRLERVDMETITLFVTDNQRVVLRVNKPDRSVAAPFLGKRVKVDVRNEQGECRAVRFRSFK